MPLSRYAPKPFPSGLSLALVLKIANWLMSQPANELTKGGFMQRPSIFRNFKNFKKLSTFSQAPADERGSVFGREFSETSCHGAGFGFRVPLGSLAHVLLQQGEAKGPTEGPSLGGGLC